MSEEAKEASAVADEPLHPTLHYLFTGTPELRVAFQEALNCKKARRFLELPKMVRFICALRVAGGERWHRPCDQSKVHLDRLVRLWRRVNARTERYGNLTLAGHLESVWSEVAGFDFDRTEALIKCTGGEKELAFSIGRAFRHVLPPATAAYKAR